MQDRHSVLAGFRAMLVADVARLLAKGGILLLLTRFLLTPAEYGLLFLALSVLGISFLFSNFGLPGSVARYVTEYVETRPGQVPHIVRFGLSVNLVSITVVCLAVAALRGHIAAAIGEPALAPLLLVGVGFVAARSFEKHLYALFQAFNDVRYTAIVKTADSVSQPILVTAGVLAGLGVAGALAGFVVAAVLGTALGFVVLYRRFYRGRDRDAEMVAGLRTRLLRYSVPLAASGVAGVLDKRVDTVLVGYFMNPTAVAYYTLAKQISEFVMTPASSLGFTVSPQFGTHKANGELDRAATLYESAFVHTVAIYVPAAAGMIVVADPAVTFIFGTEYSGAVTAVQIFGVYALLLALDKITNDGLDYLGRANARATAKGITSAANVALNVAFIPIFGVAGAAGATVITVSGLVAVELYVIASELPLAVGRLARMVGLVFGITVGMTVAVVSLLPYVSGLLSLTGVVLVGVAVWAVLATASGLVDVRKVGMLLQ